MTIANPAAGMIDGSCVLIENQKSKPEGFQFTLIFSCMSCVPGWHRRYM